MDACLILHTKRNNKRPHTREEIEWWIKEYTLGNIPEYQMAAWLMAVCWRGMTSDETAILTKCMVESGEHLKWNDIKASAPKCQYLVDKHSTGGIGDKISLVLAPLVACLGVSVPMMAGRGLGHTGGTIDKLESIPGYQTSIHNTNFQRIVSEVGCSIVAASEEMCLADRKLYALRDVTETVSSIPLITGSIMSKKIAENPDSLVLDVKYGCASFNPTKEQAIGLGESMIQTGEANGLNPTTVFLTHMDSVIGHAVGNWNEVKECLQMMKTGQGESDLKTLVVIQSSQMIYQSKKYPELSFDDTVKLVLDALDSGKPYPFFREMVKAHSGDVSICDNPETYPHSAERTKTIIATQDGTLSELNGYVIGNVAVHLGAGRETQEEDVDPIAGIYFHVKVGEQVIKDKTVICTLQTNRSQDVLDLASKTLEENAICYSTSENVVVPPIISHKMTSNDGLVPFTIPEFLSKKN